MSNSSENSSENSSNSASKPSMYATVSKRASTISMGWWAVIFAIIAVALYYYRNNMNAVKPPSL